MKIGIDLDGVVIDSETTFRTYEELYDLLRSGNSAQEMLEEQLMDDTGEDKVDAMVESEEESNEETSEN